MRWLYIFICVFYITACTTTSNPGAASINVRLGLIYLSHQDTTLAKEKLLLALDQNPNDSSVNGAFAYFLEKTGELQDAERYYLQAIKMASAKAPAWNNYGTYLYRQGRYYEALSYFLLATKEIYYLHIANAYENAGCCALKLNALDLAKKYFQMAVQIDPGCTMSKQKLLLLK